METRPAPADRKDSDVGQVFRGTRLLTTVGGFPRHDPKRRVPLSDSGLKRRRTGIPGSAKPELPRLETRSTRIRIQTSRVQTRGQGDAERIGNRSGKAIGFQPRSLKRERFFGSIRAGFYGFTSVSISIAGIRDMRRALVVGTGEKPQFGKGRQTAMGGGNKPHAQGQQPDEPSPMHVATVSVPSQGTQAS